MPSGLFYVQSWDRSISFIRGVWLVFIIISFVAIPKLNANSVDPDQTPRSAGLSWVFTACQCPFCWTLGLNGLRY